MVCGMVPPRCFTDGYRFAGSREQRRIVLVRGTRNSRPPRMWANPTVWRSNSSHAVRQSSCVNTLGMFLATGASRGRSQRTWDCAVRGAFALIGWIRVPIRVIRVQKDLISPRGMRVPVSALLRVLCGQLKRPSCPSLARPEQRREALKLGGVDVGEHPVLGAFTPPVNHRVAVLRGHLARDVGPGGGP